MQLLYEKMIINHLGSTAFVTDGNATVTQGFLYAPFGEITTEYAPMWQNGLIPKYTFNAKELDEESGMYYYEARYYNPPVFTSRDPHFERYFWHSPYAYCGNNPLNKVDPTGMDEWEIDGSGNIVNHTKTTEHDAFYMVGEDGKRIEGKSCEFNYGTIKSSNSKLSDKSGVTVDFYDVKGDENGTKLFEFFAENTKVEWGHMQIGKGGKSNGVNYLFTSHQVDKIRGVSSDLFVINNYVRIFTHNHPNGNPNPSDRDLKSFDDIWMHNSKYGEYPTFFIYTSGNNRNRVFQRYLQEMFLDAEISLRKSIVK